MSKAKYGTDKLQKMFKSKFSLIPADQRGPEEEEMFEEQMKEPSVQSDHIEEGGRILKKPEIDVRLSWIGKTADGEGYTYLKATCTGMQLTEIRSIQCYKNLQFVDVSNNELTIEALTPVTKLPYLLLLQADSNQLISAKLPRCKYLQVIIMNRNHLTTVEDVFQSELTTLEVGYNKITEINFDRRMPKLRVLDFRYNKLRDLLGCKFANLDSLYLAGNKIKTLLGVESMPKLRVLHVRNNPIKLLAGFANELPHLKYFNLRSTKIKTLKQIKLLKNQTGLETLILKNTIYMGGTGNEAAGTVEEEEDPDKRIEVLAALPRLKRLNKNTFTEEEIAEAKAMTEEWQELGDLDEEEEEEEEEEEQIREEQRSEGSLTSLQE